MALTDAGDAPSYADMMDAESVWQQETERFRAMVGPVCLTAMERSQALEQVQNSVADGALSLSEAMTSAALSHTDSVWESLLESYEQAYGRGSMDAHQKTSVSADTRRAAVERLVGGCEHADPLDRRVAEASLPALRAAASEGLLCARRCQRIIDRAADAVFEDPELRAAMDAVSERCQLDGDYIGVSVRNSEIVGEALRSFMPTENLMSSSHGAALP